MITDDPWLDVNGAAGDRAARLERAAAAVARLAAALASHPLAAAWAYRAQLDAVRLQAADDGLAIDLWSLAALIEGVRRRLDPAARLSQARSHVFCLGDLIRLIGLALPQRRGDGSR